MTSYRVSGTIFIASFIIFLSACKPSATGDTVSETSGAAAEPYKEAPMLDVATFDKGIQKSKSVVLDVRMPQEFEQGHIEGAININFFDPNFKYQLLELEKNKKYYVYCKNDARSERAAEFMLKNDYPEVYVLDGGYDAWQEAGKK